MLSQPDGVQIIHGGVQADGAGEIGRAGLEFVRRRLPGAVEKIHAGDHVAAALERRHFLQQFAPAIEDADAGRAANFVAGKGEEIAADFLHVHRAVAGALGGVHQGDDAAAAGAGAEFGGGIDRAEGVGNVGEGEELHVVVQRLVQAAQIQQARRRR